MALTYDGLCCGICHGPTYAVLDFGQMPLANGYAEPDRREPLSMRFCRECHLYQLDSVPPAAALFDNYTYRTSATNQHPVWRRLVADSSRLLGDTFGF